MAERKAENQNEADFAVQRVVLVDADPTRSSLLRHALEVNGYELVGRVKEVGQMLASVLTTHPDFVVLGIDSPDQSSIQQLVALKEQAPLPIIIFSEQGSPQIIQKIVQAGVSAFIVDDIQPRRLPSIIAIAVARFQAQQGLIRELEATRSKLAERKILDRAKGLLMQQKGISEDEAYRSLRKMAMDRGQPIVQVAETVIDVLQLLEGSVRT